MQAEYLSVVYIPPASTMQCSFLPYLPDDKHVYVTRFRSIQSIQVTATLLDLAA